MKRRQGFVSNSSSSSFIVRFKEDPRYRENLEKEMGQCDTDYGYGAEYTTDEVVDRVFRDIMDVGLATNETIQHELGSHISLDWDDYEDENGRVNWTEYEKDREVKSKEALERFMQQDGGKYVVVLSYSDECSEGALEHGNIFRNVKGSIRVSHH